MRTTTWSGRGKAAADWTRRCSSASIRAVRREIFKVFLRVGRTYRDVGDAVRVQRQLLPDSRKMGLMERAPKMEHAEALTVLQATSLRHRATDSSVRAVKIDYNDERVFPRCSEARRCNAEEAKHRIIVRRFRTIRAASCVDRKCVESSRQSAKRPWQIRMTFDCRWQAAS